MSPAGRLYARPKLLPPVVVATADVAEKEQQAETLAKARAFAVPLIAGEALDTGENILQHADAVAAILADIGGSLAMQAASYLVYACPHLNKPEEAMAKTFGPHLAQLAIQTNQLVHVQRLSRASENQYLHTDNSQLNPLLQAENVRKMLLAFSRDLRVVMLRLASRLQTLRHFAASKLPVPAALASESLQVFAPLANRLGIWQIKWEVEDLSFRFLEPDTYRDIARLLDEKRTERESHMLALRESLQLALANQGIAATVEGRPKHIYSIVRKMRGKSLSFDRVFDLRALRVVVPDVADCYQVLSWVHEQFTPIVTEFDDYIAKPKANGYQSLHTVVRDADGGPIEVQIRTQAMHEHAEHGVAAHWAYKEAGSKGYSGVSADSDYDTKIAVLRQLLAWERDLSGAAQEKAQGKGLFDDRIYVLTPDAAVVELPQGATPIDFAYTVHTLLGHRCRGAKVDGAMVPLNTSLANGQTVEITAIKEGGPSRDWLNPDLGYLASPRARAKVRAWFNAQVSAETIARGREAVEKSLQRLGRTAIRLDDLASQLGFKSADGLFEVVGKDEYSLRNIEVLLNPPEPALEPAEYFQKKFSAALARKSPSGVLVVGVDSLLTQLSRCCKPAPPDAIGGFVTRGKGVSIHRQDCSNFRELASRHAERVIEVRWGEGKASEGSVYPVDVSVEAIDRQGLLRDISEVFTKEKMNVIGVQTQSVKGTAWMTFTVEIGDAVSLNRVLVIVRGVKGVRAARRR
ncbi:MAG: bifunctional (p)ppGpp synthetase/guanosine-3',5'-bis(diphosphate) 3'-pyrophosphohydrolase [Limnohabitans sp.]|jgi:GTP pyrophosphokinase|nr:bifunctional (p)ppGpp synthetase/guanosine-3',5'-bis(diphosphate) 3'-pyrophosphohydrolase [Limnohabitans sp.]MCO4088378.1 bifunctional (p)ppGpp synthetase/guanosine-3',5'-bis(diphosphate) 3'-pyrophosphohydrolase [Limnohabitans sp.]